MNKSSQAKLKMLIVDDEPDNLDLLYRTFRLEFQVFRAESAIAALDLLEEHGEVAIIISDQRMPEMLGTEFLSKTVERFPDTIRIVLTAYTDVKDLVDAINSGKVFKYITKPWNQQQLQAVVRQAAETYRVVKQRTEELRRSLRRESLFNAVNTAIRESLDYSSMLQAIVETLGKAFTSECCSLHPIENGFLSSQVVQYIAHDHVPANLWNPTMPLIRSVLEDYSATESGFRAIKTFTEGNTEQNTAHVIIPLTYQTDLLAILSIVRKGDLNQWSTEDLDLLEGVSEQAVIAISQAKLYQRTQKQAEQIRAELAVARQIQNNLLRQTLPELPGVCVQACCHPAREVGGDFFEVYQHPQGDLWLAVGDVSGKGVPAALFMASAISVLRRELAQETSPNPEDVMQNLNRILLDDLVSTNCFITMVLARFNPLTRQLVYANAGHLYPLLWSRQVADAEIVPQYLTNRGVPLGIRELWKAPSGSAVLNPGDTFLLMSDGVTEVTIRSQMQVYATTPSAVNSGMMLQQAGFWKLLQEDRDCLDLKRLLARIRAATLAQEDDQTMLSLEVL